MKNPSHLSEFESALRRERRWHLLRRASIALAFVFIFVLLYGLAAFSWLYIGVGLAGMGAASVLARIEYRRAQRVDDELDKLDKHAPEG
jgi:Flp pilus assembly protein TadB